MKILTNLIRQDVFKNFRQARGDGDCAIVIRLFSVIFPVQCLFKFIGKARFSDAIVHKKI